MKILLIAAPQQETAKSYMKPLKTSKSFLNKAQ